MDYRETCWKGLDRISENCWRVDLKRALRPFDLCKLDLMGHRWHGAMAI